MLCLKLSFRWISLVTLLLLGLDGSASTAHPISIASVPRHSAQTLTPRSAFFPISGMVTSANPDRGGKRTRSKPRYTPGGRGTPTRTAAGTVRGNICRGDQPLVALVPYLKTSMGEVPKVEVATTIADRPSFFFYVPPMGQRPVGSSQPITFTLYNQNKKRQWSTELPGNISGVVSVNLPKTASPLEVNQVYNWVLKVECDPRDPTERAEVEGWTMRVLPPPELRKQLAQTPPEEVPAVYAQFGIWNEAVSSLIELRRQKPNASNLLEDWKELLDSANLTIPVTQGK